MKSYYYKMQVVHLCQDLHYEDYIKYKDVIDKLEDVIDIIQVIEDKDRDDE